MKKSLLALAVLGAFAGAAQAQTSVTVYGSFDGGIRHQSDVDAAGHSNTTMGSNGTYNSNRLGFRGVEDLGGGMNAHFTLESGFNTGTGALDNANNQLFNRSAYVGLGGSWGALDLGRQYSVNFQTVGLYDPFNYKYVSIVPLAGLGGLTRLNNDVKYTGTFGGVAVRAEYALGEVAGSASTGSTEAIGGSYEGGPFTVGAAYTTGKTAADFDKRNWTIGGAYATGPFRVVAGYNDNRVDASATTDTKAKDWWLGGSYAVTPAAAVSLGFYETKTTDVTGADGKRQLFILGGTYALSKRTNFYADVDNRRYSDAAIGVLSPAGESRQAGVSVGINHLF